MNVGYIVMNNLQVGNEDTTNEMPQQNNGLLARGIKPQKPKKLEPRDRIAEYVSQIRKGRMELKNG